MDFSTPTTVPTSSLDIAFGGGKSALGSIVVCAVWILLDVEPSCSLPMVTLRIGQQETNCLTDSGLGRGLIVEAVSKNVMERTIKDRWEFLHSCNGVTIGVLENTIAEIRPGDRGFNQTFCCDARFASSRSTKNCLLTFSEVCAQFGRGLAPSSDG